MTRPTDTGLAAALAEAQRLREAGEDSHNIAKALICLAHRSACLSGVREAAERYRHSGLAEHEHALLVKALDHAAAEETRERYGDRENLGLG